MPIGENWVNDRSRCPGCSHELQSYELLPIFSYLIQGGKCRVCHMKIKPIYLLSEIVAGLLFVIPIMMYGFEGLENGTVYLAWAFLSMLIIVTVSDIYYQMMLKKVILFFAIVILLLTGIYLPQYFLLGGIGAGLGFLMLYVFDLLKLPLLKQESLCKKYGKLYLVIGFLLGSLNTLLAFIITLAIYAIYKALLSKGKNKPMGLGIFISLISYLCFLFQFII
ncbi:MAG: prepilin peptidase [Turicibacter sp.]|nr:prepilin peptidase [Turicibacter sp.]